MTGKEFLKAVTNGETDLLQAFLDVLREAGAAHCVIGGLAVNAYAEPVVSLDLDVVVATDRVDRVAESAAARGMKVERFPHSVNLSATGSDLRIQLRTDPRYQEFVHRAEERRVLGYPLRVAALADVLQGKLWAYQDESRRGSKRQKDLADIARLVEAHPELEPRPPEPVRERILRELVNESPTYCGRVRIALRHVPPPRRRPRYACVGAPCEERSDAPSRRPEIHPRALRSDRHVRRA